LPADAAAPGSLVQHDNVLAAAAKFICTRETDDACANDNGSTHGLEPIKPPQAEQA